MLTDLLVYRVLLGFEVSAGVAKGLSFLAGVAVGYPLNRWLTFAAEPTRRRRRTANEVSLYLLVYLVSLAVNIGANAFVLAAVGEQRTTLAFVIATGVTTVLNFVLLKLVVFRTSPTGPESSV